MGASGSTISHSAAPKIFSVSDLHTDEAENWTLLQSHISERVERLKGAHEAANRGPEEDLRNEDVLIVAGDVSSKTKVIRSTKYLYTLIQKFE